MTQRLAAMKRVLKKTGSIYLHCDPYASHYLKLIMDGIYGRKNFRNEIIWKRTNPKGMASRKLPSNHDTILFYVLSPATDSELPFERRLVEVYKAGCDYAQAIDIALPNAEIYADTPINLGPAVFNLLKSPRMLSAVESLIGGEIYSNPIQHIRIKTPKKFIVEQDKYNSLYGKTYWHQDVGVGLEEADDTQMLTCWVAISEATVENGCLQVVPKSHRQGIALHCTPGQLSIPEQLIELDEAVPVPLNPGGVLFFHPLCKHASLDNHSDSFRWSFDLRYNPIGQPTGRPHFPGFVAQSRLNPDSVLDDWREWAQLWHDARDRLAAVDAVRVHRWEDDDPLCA